MSQGRTRLLLISFVALIVLIASCASNQNTSRTNTAMPASSPMATSPMATVPPNASPAMSQGKVNVNTATEAELLSAIPGLGNRMVREFQEYRPYSSIQQFRKEIGKYVDAAQVAEYEKYIFVPIKINQADEATLMQIPGVDETEAKALIAGRPYASTDVFINKLSDKVSPANKELARKYVSQ